MKISIITPALNAADTICDTIASVIDQTYNDIEFIFVDRGSTDETLPIFLSMRHSMETSRTKHISVEGMDIFKAIEKGVEIATGDIITVLGAGDFYSSDDVVSSVMDQFSTGRMQMVYGDMKFVNSQNTQKVTRQTCGRFYRRWPNTSGMTKCHPALFMTKELFIKNGGYRQGFSLAADYELMVRLLSERNHARKYLRKDLVSIRQDKVNSAEADAYRKELWKAFELNDQPEAKVEDPGVKDTDSSKDKATEEVKALVRERAKVKKSATAASKRSTRHRSKSNSLSQNPAQSHAKAKNLEKDTSLKDNVKVSSNSVKTHTSKGKKKSPKDSGAKNTAPVTSSH